MSTSPEAQRVIWLTFLDLLPKTLLPEHHKAIIDAVGNGRYYAKIVYDAAVHAGYLRGWAEGDGAHRQPKELIRTCQRCGETDFDPQVPFGSIESTGFVCRGCGSPMENGKMVPPKGSHVDIVFDGPPGPETGRFVEVEDAKGANIKLGEWIHRDDGFWVLRIVTGTSVTMIKEHR